MSTQLVWVESWNSNIFGWNFTPNRERTKRCRLSDQRAGTSPH